MLIRMDKTPLKSKELADFVTQARKGNNVQ